MSRNTALAGRLPDTFLVGAMKAGTTTLYDCLRHHPDLYMPEEKEPFYFLWADRAADRFRLPAGKRLIGTEHWMVIRTEGQYRRLFQNARPDQRIGEASTFYLPDPEVPGRIKSAIPDPRVIAILRDPAARAYSAYTFQQSLGLEPASAFREAIEAERRGERDDWLYGWRHLYCGRYAEQIERYFRTFGEDRVLILEFQDLQRDVEAVARRVFSFLGLDPEIQLPAIPASNVTAIPSPGWPRRMKFLFSRPNPLKETVKHALPRPVRRQIKSWAFRLVDSHSARPSRLDPSDRSMLLDLFEPDRIRLERLLGRDLSGWVSP